MSADTSTPRNEDEPTAEEGSSDRVFTSSGILGSAFGLGGLLSPALMNARDRGMFYAHLAADELERAGEHDLAKAVRNAVRPKRSRGRPPVWGERERANLGIEMMHLMIKRRRRGILALAKELTTRPHWSGFTADALKGQYEIWLKGTPADLAHAVKEYRDMLRSIRKPGD